MEKPQSSCALRLYGGVGGIRTLVPRRANAFRVRPVMTTSIRHQWFLFYSIGMDFATIKCGRISRNKLRYSSECGRMIKDFQEKIDRRRDGR